MRDGSLLCTGKGNPDWNCSAPHGAGRVLSRTQAYEKITMEDFEASMKGIYSESVNDFTRDESPMVYKPAEEIIDNIGDTVNIDSIIRPIFNFKASKWKLYNCTVGVPEKLYGSMDLECCIDIWDSYSLILQPVT